MTPTLRQLEYLVAVSDHGGFHRAAEACHVTQPGLSAQIQQLETTLGVTLFERNRRTVLVTRAGAELVERARAILTAAGELVDAARGYAGPFGGRLRLGVIPTIAPYVLPRLLPKLRRRDQQLRIQLYEARTHELVERLGAGRLDVLLLALEAPLGDVETLAVADDPFVVAVPADHRLAKRRALREDDLAGEPVLLLDDGHCLRDQALSICSAAGIAEADDLRAASLGTLVQMVRMGAGFTLLPSIAEKLETKGPGVVTVPFRRPVPKRTIGLAWRRTSPWGDAFGRLGALVAETVAAS